MQQQLAEGTTNSGSVVCSGRTKPRGASCLILLLSFAAFVLVLLLLLAVSETRSCVKKEDDVSMGICDVVVGFGAIMVGRRC